MGKLRESLKHTFKFMKRSHKTVCHWGERKHVSNLVLALGDSKRDFQSDSKWDTGPGSGGHRGLVVRNSVATIQAARFQIKGNTS
jgi:hypothetical protein